MPLVLAENAPLAPLCTLELGGAARWLAHTDDDASLRAALAFARARSLPWTLLGGGSNVVIADAGFDGVVIRHAPRGIEMHDAGESVQLRATAGEPWDAVVTRSIEAGLAGLECLSGIPGLVGAVPIQNVGAYGHEVAQSITSVRVIHARDGTTRDVSNEACGFAYRDSAFKRRDASFDDAIVLGVTFRLRRGPPDAIRYAELANVVRGARPTLVDVRDAVLALRASKSMLLSPDDPNRRSVGSFFTNPVLDAEHADAVITRAIARGEVQQRSDVPAHAQRDGRTKIPAAWLIEHAGFRKGERRGAVGISTRHALALVHHGGGTTRELLAFADEIRQRVDSLYGVQLTLEPVLVGVDPVRAHR